MVDEYTLEFDRSQPERTKMTLLKNGEPLGFIELGDWFIDAVITALLNKRRKEVSDHAVG